MKLTHSIVAAVIAGLFVLPAVAQTPAPGSARDAVKADRQNLKADRKAGNTGTRTTTVPRSPSTPRPRSAGL